MKNKSLVLVLSALLTLFVSCKQNNETQEETNRPLNKEVNIKQPSINIKTYQQLISPQKITVNSEGVWLASEGNLGWIALIDENGKELSRGFLQADGEWMTPKPALFSTTLNFDTGQHKKGVLIIHNNPGEGEGKEAGKQLNFKVPVTF